MDRDVPKLLSRMLRNTNELDVTTRQAGWTMQRKWSTHHTGPRCPKTTVDGGDAVVDQLCHLRAKGVHAARQCIFCKRLSRIACVLYVIWTGRPHQQNTPETLEGEREGFVVEGAKSK